MDDNVEMTDADITPQIPKKPKVSKENLPFIEKYRPDTLKDIVSHEEILNTLNRFVDQKNIPHLLFHGPAGTGKTSCIFALARQIYGGNNKYNVLELNASDERGIEVVREKIKEFCSSQMIVNKGIKLVILDEADMMTTVAQMALRRVIEKFTKNVRFCLICNQVNKIIMPIQSRCMRFRFAPLKPEQCIERIKYICGKEEIEIDDQTMRVMIKIGKGDMRKILNILESTWMSKKVVNVNSVYELTGLPNPSQMDFMINYMFTNSYEDAYKTINKYRLDNGFAINDILLELLDRVSTSEIVTCELLILLTKRFSELDHLVNLGSNEKILMGNLVGIFQVLKENGIKELKRII